MLFGPIAWWRIEICAAAMLGKCWSSQSGKIDSARAWLNRPMSNAPSEPTPRMIGLDQFADIHRRDPRPHANPESRGVEPAGLDAGVLHRHRGRSHGEPDRPAHQLQVLLVLSQVGENVEVLDLSGDLDTQTRRVKTLDVIHAGTPFENGLAEFAATNSVGRDHADSGHDHAVHFVPHAHSLR